ncbi:complex I intermediate-associated protein 30, mitochondrial [Condylostylus longicornis]|uniref:complex I intermediate-associated protein 30, mitochondrial n=1 Tax=Condylostylus longicornis TaxID=2530218 RepID=UPI00244DEC1F|nr:complex I intermediate-associated protein 30, mitochondrial [Condylostylus longicornis]
MLCCSASKFSICTFNTILKVGPNDLFASQNLKNFNLNLIRTTFWESNKKSGYQKPIKFPSKKKQIIDGFKELKNEISLWKKEVREKFEGDPVLVYRPGEVDVAFQFNDQQDIDKWVVTTDKDHNEGKSSATLERNSAGAGHFYGYLDSQFLKDGKIKRTGYANIRTIRVMRSFKREVTYDWTQYNTLVLKVRGDGRNYLINLHTEGYFDLLWNDIYHYVLYTRGGPHWQISKIPFSKFFLASKGRVQDRQGAIPLNCVTHIGFSVGAKGGCDGPFSLEVGYIGLEYDPNHRETFAYEMYRTPKYIVAT